MAIAIFTLVIAGIAAGDDALIRIGLVLFFVWIGSYFVVAIVTRRIPLAIRPAKPDGRQREAPCD